MGIGFSVIIVELYLLIEAGKQHYQRCEILSVAHSDNLPNTLFRCLIYFLKFMQETRSIYRFKKTIEDSYTLPTHQTSLKVTVCSNEAYFDRS